VVEPTSPDLPVDPDAGFCAGHRLLALAAVAAGGAVGGTSRAALSTLAPVTGGELPWVTLAANLSGSFLLALLLACVRERRPVHNYVRLFAGTGLLGSFTTFSTWMLEVVDLVGVGSGGVAAAYLAGSVVAGLGAVVLGLMVGRALAAQGRALAARRGGSR
jgi:CrcB protein